MGFAAVYVSDECTLVLADTLICAQRGKGERTSESSRKGQSDKGLERHVS